MRDLRFSSPVLKSQISKLQVISCVLAIILGGCGKWVYLSPNGVNGDKGDAVKGKNSNNKDPIPVPPPPGEQDRGENRDENLGGDHDDARGGGHDDAQGGGHDDAHDEDPDDGYDEEGNVSTEHVRPLPGRTGTGRVPKPGPRQHQNQRKNRRSRRRPGVPPVARPRAAGHRDADTQLSPSSVRVSSHLSSEDPMPLPPFHGRNDRPGGQPAAMQADAAEGTLDRLRPNGPRVGTTQADSIRRRRAGIQVGLGLDADSLHIEVDRSSSILGGSTHLSSESPVQPPQFYRRNARLRGHFGAMQDGEAQAMHDSLDSDLNPQARQIRCLGEECMRLEDVVTELRDENGQLREGAVRLQERLGEVREREALGIVERERLNQTEQLRLDSRPGSPVGVSTVLRASVAHLRPYFIDYPYQFLGLDNVDHAANLNELLNPNFITQLLKDIRSSEGQEKVWNEFEYLSEDNRAHVSYSLYSSPQREGQEGFLYLVIRSINGAKYDVGSEGTFKSHYWALRLDSAPLPGSAPFLFCLIEADGKMGKGAERREFYKTPQELYVGSHIEDMVKDILGTGIERKHLNDFLLNGKKYSVLLKTYGGTDLSDRQNSDMDSGQKRLCIQNLVSQLQLLHSNNILPRDIKPENVLYLPGVNSSICNLDDFGAAMAIVRGRVGPVVKNFVISAGFNYSPWYLPFQLSQFDFNQYRLREIQSMKLYPTVKKGTTLETLGKQLVNSKNKKISFEPGDEKFMGEAMDLFQMGLLTSHILTLGHEEMGPLKKNIERLKQERNRSQRVKIIRAIQGNIHKVCSRFRNAEDKSYCMSTSTTVVSLLSVADATGTNEASTALAKLCFYKGCGCSQNVNQSGFVDWRAVKANCVKSKKVENDPTKWDMKVVLDLVNKTQSAIRRRGSVQ